MAFHIEINPDLCLQNRNWLALSTDKIGSFISILISDIFNNGLDKSSGSNL